MQPLTSLIPELQPFAQTLIDAAGAAGLLPRVTSTRRSAAEQKALYERFLRGQQPYPVARPGTSAHETGEAFDMLVTPYDALPDVAAYWQSMGGEWGGNRDPVHFQWPGAPSAELIAQLARSGKGSRVIDFLLGFLPYESAVQTFSTILSMFPAYSDSELLEILQHPTAHIFEASNIERVLTLGLL